MPRKRQSWWQQCLLIADETTSRAKRAFAAAPRSASDSNPLLSDLEPRVLFSATPMDAGSMPGGDQAAMVVEVEAEEAETEIATSETAAEQSPAQQSPHEVVIIDAAVPELQQLLDDLEASQRDLDVFVLDSDRDGVEQISEMLDQHSEIDSLHIISHAEDGAVKLGNVWLSDANVVGYAGQIAMWQDALTADADILFYGCDLAASDGGRMLADSISALSGADVAASSDDTGHAALAGDWELEYTVGVIETKVAISADAQADWLYVLQLETVRDSFGSVSYSNNDGSQVWSTSWQEVGDSGGASGGDIEVVTTNSGALRFGGSVLDVGDYIWRQADLTGATTATLSLDAKREDGKTQTTAVNLEVRAHPTDAWTPLANYDQIPYSYTTYTHNITAFISPETQIRLDTTIRDTDDIFFDNIQIEYETASALIVDTTADVLDGNTNSIEDLIANKGADGFISLREAIIATNNTAGANTIELSAGNYEFLISGNDDDAMEGDLDVLGDLTIIGNDAADTVIDAKGFDRVFHVINSSLTMTDVTIQGGSITDKGGGVFVKGSSSELTLDRVIVQNNFGDDGAGIFNEGMMTLTDVVVANNGHLVDTYEGGGIHNKEVAILNRVTISGNQADQGGGIHNDNSVGTSITMTNVTVSGNAAAAGGGGLYSQNTATIINSTFTLNTADSGGGIRVHAGNTTITNTIVAGNTGTSANDDVQGTFHNSSSYNLIGDGTGSSNLVNGSNGNQVGDNVTPIDAMLDPLGDNGGPTRTHAILAGSPAIDPSGSETPPSLDQRGFSRDGSPDVGAFEYLASPIGTTIAYEPFDYAAGSLNGQNGGTGWATAWALDNGTSAQVDSTGLTTPPGLPTGQGGTLEMSTFIQFEQGRNLSTTLGADGTTAWFSFLLKPDGTSGGISLVIGDGTGADNTVNVGTNGSDFLVGIDGTATGVQIDNAVVDAQTYFLVVQIDFTSGNDTVTLYVDPTAGVSTPDSPAPMTAQLTTADLGTFTHVGVIGGFGGNNSNIDEIRVATSFEGVASSGVNAAPTDISPNPLSVDENTDTTGGYSFGTLSASDPNSGDTFTWSKLAGGDGALFTLNATTGELTFDDGVLDHETKDTYTVNVRVTDSASNNYDETITVNVNDLNDNDPTVDSGQSFNVSELAPMGTSLGLVSASDDDAGTMFSNWSITGGNTDGIFFISSGTGEIQVFDNANLNHEATDTYLLEISVSDGTNTSNSQTVTINVIDEDESPSVTSGGVLSYTEGAGPVILNPAITVDDPDGTLASATIQILSHTATEDELHFTNQNGISGAYDAGTGILNLSGSASVAHYQAALRSIQYENHSVNPNTTTRMVSINVSDGSMFASGSRSIDVNAVGPLAVDTTSDESDGDTSSIAALVVDKGTDGKVSLREAIEAANNSAVLETIQFQINDPPTGGEHIIVLDAALPLISKPIFLDATTDDDYFDSPVIRIDGSSAGAIDGLVLAAGSEGSTIRGLAITGFDDAAFGNAIVIHSDNNLIAGNYIGIQSDGSTTDGNRTGIDIVGGAGNTIGGTDDADRNVIAPNNYAAIAIHGSTAGGNQVLGNYLGLAADGSTVLGGHYGVVLWSDADGNTIGGTSADEGNRIAGYNRGVYIAGNDASGPVDISILGNEIYQSNILGIALSNDGVTANGTSGPGPNNYQNYPVLISAITDGVSEITIDGTLAGTALASYRIEFFASSTGQPSGHGDAETYLGFANVTADNLGVATFSETLSEMVPDGHTITATATDTNGNTSEFAANINATLPPPLSVVQRETMDVDADGQIDHIKVTTSSNLNDDFSGLALSVTGYTLDATTPYLTNLGAGGDNDDVFYVKLQQSGSPDTGTTPDVEVTANTTLAEFGGGSTLQLDLAAVTASDKAPPVLLSAVSTQVIGSTIFHAPGHQLDLVFSESLIGLPGETDLETALTFAAGASDGNNLPGIGSGTNPLSLVSDVFIDDTIRILFGTGNTANIDGLLVGTHSVQVTDGTSLIDAAGNLANVAASALIVGELNDPPTLTAVPTNPTFVEDGPPAALFSGTTASTIEAGQAFIELQVSVSNISDGAAEILVADGSAIALVHGNSDTTAFNALDYTVSVAGSTATVTFTGNVSSSQMESVVNSLTYQNQSDAPGITDRVVSLDVVKDSGGTAAGGNDTTTLGMTSIVEITPTNDPASGVPVITGTLQEDETLTAVTTGISDFDGPGSFSYQWFRGVVAISGANSDTYVLGDDDVGQQISVEVSFFDPYGTLEGPLASDPTTAIANVNDLPTGLPVIIGTAEEDQLLFADTTGISDDDNGIVSFNYQWLRGGTIISGATGSMYTLGDDDVGELITVEVRVLDGHGTLEDPLTSAATSAVQNVNDLPVGTVSISGIVAEDEVLTATHSLDDDDGMGTVTYHWHRDGLDITGANSNTYTLTDDDVGAIITVEASYIDGHGKDEHVSSNPVGPVANRNDDPVVDVPIADQTAQQNDAFSFTFAANTFSDVDGDNLTYSAGLAGGGLLPSWLSFDDSNRTFSGTPTAADVGSLMIRVTANDGNGGSAFDDFEITVIADQAPTELVAVKTKLGGLSLNEDGGNDAYLIADDGGALFAGATALTVETQFASTTPPPNFGYATLLSYANGTDPNGDDVRFGVRRNDSISQFELEFSVNGQFVYASSYDASLLFDGQTHRTSITWDSTSGQYNFFVDGISVDSGTSFATGHVIAGGGELTIGSDQDSMAGSFEASQVFRGTLLDVRVFDDVRTPGEVSSSVEATLPYQTQGMIANWTFNDLSTADVVMDTVGGNNLTVQHASGPGFISSQSELTLRVNETAGNGTLVAQVAGTDSERETVIAQLLAANPDLSYSAETNKFYQHVNSATDWAGAQTSATTTLLSGVSGQLVTIHSAAEQEIVHSIAAASAQSIWLGGSDQVVEGDWFWYDGLTEQQQFWLGDATGSSVAGRFQNWAPAEPSNLVGDEDFARLNVGGPQGGLWQTATAIDTHGFVIEWDADDVLDQTEPLTHQLTDDSDGRFMIDPDSGRILVADASLIDYESATSHDVTVRVTDSAGNTYDQSFTIDVNELNEAPRDITLDNTSVAENLDGGAIGKVGVVDDDLGDSHTWFVSDSRFEVDSTTLKLRDGQTLNKELEATVDVIITVTDAAGLDHDQSFTITVDNVNESPTDITIDNTSVVENAVGAVIGNLSVSDPDDGDTHAFSVSDSRFVVVGSQLQLAATQSLNHESDPTISLTITATDQGGAGISFDKILVINVDDINEAPIADNDSHRVAAGETLDVNAPGVLAGDFDPEGDAFTAVLVTGPSHGTLTLNPDGSFTYTPDPGFTGTDAFVYQAVNASGPSNSAVVTIAVNSVIGTLPPPAPDPGDDDDGTVLPPPPPPEEPPVIEEDPSPPDQTTPGGSPTTSAPPPPSTPTPVVIPVNTAEETTSLLVATDQSDDEFEEGEEETTTKARTSSDNERDRWSNQGNIFQLTSQDSQSQILNEFRESALSPWGAQKIYVGTAVSTSLTLSVGYVFWTVRAGWLASALMTSMPVWRSIDPLPVLEYIDRETDGTDDETLQSIIQQQDNMESESN